MQLSAPLVDKVALITGASGGIGSTIARALGAVGMFQVLTGRTGTKLQRTAEVLDATGLDPSRFLTIAGDLRDPELPATLVRAAHERFGGLDVVIHCAGVGHFKPFMEHTANEVDDIVAVTLTAAAHLARAAYPQLQARQGHIIHIASGLARKASGKASIYSAANYGLRGLTESLRLDFAPHGVRVSLITAAGAGVDTPFWDDHGSDLSRTGMMAPERVAEAVLIVLATREQALIDDLNLRTG